MTANADMIRRLLPGEKVAFSSTSTMYPNNNCHVIISGELLLFVSNSLTKNMPTETVVPVPMRASAWIVDAMTSLLLPPTPGGVPADQLSLNYMEAGSPSLRLRRIPSIEARDNPGFSVGNCKEKYEFGGLVSVQWPDRLLFDGGLYAVLLRIASKWAQANGQAGPRKEAFSLRPNWMGESSAETPPLEA